MTNPDHLPPPPPQDPPGAQDPRPPQMSQEQHRPDDVWGVRPPALDNPAVPGTPPPTFPHTPPPTGPGTLPPPTGSAHLDRGFSALQRSPLRRDTSAGVVGGVCAGIARQLGVSPAAVRIAAVALALFFGSGVAAYLIAWALLPDDSGQTHAERGIKGGSTGSLLIAGLAAISALGMLASLFDSLRWLVPVAVTAAVVGYVVHSGRKGKED